ncbi:hypothetical protein L9F63_002392, partial [Diploptera punctata]
IYKEALMKLLDYNWEDFKTKTAGPMTTLLPRIKPMTYRINVVFFSIHTAYCVMRVANGLLTTNAYFGFDVSKSPLFEIMNISQYLMAWTCFILFFGCTSLTAFLVATACSHLEEIRDKLLNLKKSENIKQELDNCIRHHQKTLEFVRDLENLANKSLLGQFFLILGGMCLCAFSGAMSLRSPLHLSQAILSYLAFLSQLYVNCWFGTELTEQAQLVSQAAYSSDWVGIPVQIQRNISFVIASANKEIYLTAGKFVPASRATMLNVINQTISYLMFLINVSDKEDD